MRTRTIALVAAFAALWAPLGNAQQLAAQDQRAPIFRLPVYNPGPVGATVTALDRYVGSDATDKEVKAVLLSFMASFCAPCKKEMPYLQTLHERYRDFGLRVMMVSIDTEPDGMKQIDELIAEHKVTFPVLKDRFNLVARRWLGSQSPLPSLFMVRPDGTISMVHRGYDEDATEFLQTEVERALGIKRIAPPVAERPQASEPAAAEAVRPASGKKPSAKSGQATQTAP